MARLTGASYAKIALAVALALMLFAVAGLGTSCSKGQFRWGSDTMMGSAAVAAGDIKNIEIGWAAGSVQVHVVDSGSDEIELVETGSGITRAQEMRWSVSGDTLKVDYGSWFSCFSLHSKHLEVRIPSAFAQDLGRLKIDGASGDYTIRDIGCDVLEVGLASGKLDASGFTAKELAIDVASGKSYASGVVTEKVKTHAASGKIEVVCNEVCPRTIDVDMASGKIGVSIPENDGFTVRLDKASGSFESQFATSMQSDNLFVYKNGGADIDVDIASGTFTLGRTS